MDSDIDIEEHNLLENPALRAIFPDITVLKQELIDYEYEAAETPKITEIEEIATKELNFKSENREEVLQKKFLKQNLHEKNQNILFGNKIILGSKPKVNSNSNDFKQTIDKSKQAIIILSDITPILEKCKKFCKDCSILFPKEDKLIDHRKSVHSEKNICKQCNKSFYQKHNLNRHIKNIHIKKIKKHSRIITASRITNYKKANQVKIATNKVKEKVATVSCFHCSDKFDSKQLLIEHLYAVLEPKLITKMKSPKSNNRSFKHSQFRSEVNKTDNNDIPQKQQEVNDDSSSQILNENTKKQIQLFFKCLKCSHYFKDKKIFSKHMIRKHRTINFLKNRVEFNSKCEFCTHCCSTIREYNQHLHNHRMCMLQNSKKKKSKVTGVQKQNYRVLVKADESYRRPNVLIPKSTVFKCCKCDIYFISPSLALNHTEHIQILIHWKCSECNFIFKRNEAYFHMRQHTHAKSFTVTEICDRTFSKLLYSCPKCTIHYQEENFILHYTSCGSSTLQCEYCNICDILIDSEINTSHINIHNEGNKNNTDFLTIHLVDNVIDRQQLVYTERRKRKFNSDIFAQNLHLNYCKTCKCFISTVHKVAVHQESQCTQILRHPCRFCGLILTGKGIMTHRSMHYNNRLLKLQDFIFYDLDTGKRIRPPIPELPKCEGCKKHFLNKGAIIKHVCGKDVEVVCIFCEMKFSEAVYKVHLPFHKYVLDNRKPIRETREEKYCDSFTNSHNFDAPIMSWSERQGTIEKAIYLENSVEKSNLFCCKLCSIYVDTYDKVIEHCQLHLIEKSSQDSIEFDKPANNVKIYYFDLFYYGSKNEIWLRHVFNGLSSEDINKKLFNSLYRHESRIKLEISQEGNSDFTEYKCETCQHFVDCLSLFKHVDGCITNPRKYSCKICKLPFTTKNALSKHLQMHGKSLEANNFRIVSFNRRIDHTINQLIKSNPSRPYVVYMCRNCEGLVTRTNFSTHICNICDLQKCTDCGLLLYNNEYEAHLMKHKQLNTFTENNMKVILLGFKSPDLNKNINSISASFMGIVCDYTFYKCSKCYVCIRNFRCTSKHFCLVDAAKDKCLHCGLYFDEGKLKGHIKLHSDDQDFVKSNIITIDFDPNENKKKDDIKAVIEKERSKPPVVADQNDYDCVDGEETLRVSNVVEKTAILYRCAKCNLHYLNKSGATEHIRKRPQKITKQLCTKCGFPFTPHVLFQHLLEHHGKKDIIYNFEVVDVFGKFKKQNIYKCTKCNLHFPNPKKMYAHFTKCLGSSTDGEKCKYCGLMFHFSYLQNHEHSEKNAHVDYEVVDAENELCAETLGIPK